MALEEGHRITKFMQLEVVLMHLILSFWGWSVVDKHIKI